MPKSTFNNLSKEKREQIMEAALDEFSSNSYAEASINRICKACQIAKGSFYQYFEDKLDLYTYLLTEANEVKLQYFSETLSKLDQLGFIEQIKALYISGVEFALQNPKLSNLAREFAKEKDSEVRQAILKGNEQKAQVFYEVLIEKAKAKETIKITTNTAALAMLIHALNNAVYDYMIENFGDMDYISGKTALYDFVDELLSILKNGI